MDDLDFCFDEKIVSFDKIDATHEQIYELMENGSWKRICESYNIKIMEIRHTKGVHYDERQITIPDSVECLILDNTYNIILSQNIKSLSIFSSCTNIPNGVVVVEMPYYFPENIIFPESVKTIIVIFRTMTRLNDCNVALDNIENIVLVGISNYEMHYLKDLYIPVNIKNVYMTSTLSDKDIEEIREEIDIKLPYGCLLKLLNKNFVKNINSHHYLCDFDRYVAHIL